MNKKNRVNMNRNRSIKLQIIYKFILSMILALVLSLGSMMLVVVLLEHVDNARYLQFMDWYNTDVKGMILLMALFLLSFVIHTFWIFLVQMNTITDAIDRISTGVHAITGGEMNTVIPVREQNELGRLATEINQMTETIRTSIEKEKQWNQERYHMITNMSHDLKTPLMSISGYVDLISSGRYQDEQELHQYCDIVGQKTAELNTVIGQLLQLSRISASDFKLNKVSVNLYQFTQQVLMTFIPELDANAMKYSISMKPELELYADPMLLKSVYENLISNTIKYAAQGHKLEINAWSEIEEAKDKAYHKITLEFKNYGPMIPEQEQADIFKRFYREKKNIAKEGSGCGLYIVEQIVAMHDATISLQSDTDSTSFTIVF